MEHLRKIFEVLREQTLYANLKKCQFFINPVSFLGYIVTSSRIQVNQGKTEAIVNWLILKSITDVRTFHGMISFYHLFIKNFSSLVAPITECLKGSLFKWKDAAQQSFELIKTKMTQAIVLVFPQL